MTHPAATDPALALLSLAAQAVVLRLALVAVHGAVEIPTGRSGADVAEVVCHRAHGARDGYRAALDAKLLTETDGAIILPWECPIRGDGGEGNAAPAVALDAPPEAAEDPAAPRRKPSATPGAVRARTDRSLFARRQKGWSKVPAEVTWEAWAATPGGTAFVAQRVARYPGYEQGHASGSREGHARVTPQGHTPGSHPSGLAPAVSETVVVSGQTKNEEKSESSDAREGHTPGSHPRVTPLAACPSEEPTHARPEAAEVFAALRGAGVSLSVSTAHEVELHHLLTDLARRGQPLTRTRMARFAGHVGGHLRTSTATHGPWRPKLDKLRGPDGKWTLLLSLLDESDDCARCTSDGTRSTAPRKPHISDAALRARARGTPESAP